LFAIKQGENMSQFHTNKEGFEKSVEEEPNGYALRREKFRKKILDAAEALIVETGDLSFGMRELAVEAKVSAATPFNHFGSKHGVLNGIIERSLNHLSPKRIVQNPKEEPVAGIFRHCDEVVKYYASKPELYRPVFGEVLCAPTTGVANAIQLANSYWKAGLQAALEAGQIKPGRNLDIVASQLEANWLGPLILWVGGSLDGEAWRRQAEYGTAIVLLSLVEDSARNQLERRVEELEILLSFSTHSPN
tara:strand:+ start:824 stop:1567 length:744 start_codon:yes stop_codon:yes gene_type:complete